jgi:hypothetical protein
VPVFVVTLITKWGFSEPLASFTKLSEAEDFAKRMKAQLKEPGSKIVIYEVDEPFIDFGEFVAAFARSGRPRAVSCSSACRQRGYDDGIEYGMTKEYAFTRNWTEWEVFREFVQNALDEMHEVQASRPLYYPCRYEGLRTVIFDAGRGLATYHLLVGTSEKKPWQRGKFGEGMKIAMLTAIARGMSVTIESGDKVFAPMFIVKNLEGKEFDVFCVCYKKAKTPITGTRVWIAGSRNLCEEYKRRVVQGVLSMRPDCVLYTVKGVGKGKEPGFEPWYDIVRPECSEEGEPWIYVRDIGITSFEAASDRSACFSYNLFDVELDESRRIPAFYTVESEIKRVWYYVTWNAKWGDPKAKEMLVKFFNCLMEQCKDVEYKLKIAAEADAHVFSYVYGEERDYLIKVFHELYGEDTVVINNPELARMAEYLGVPFIFCNRRVGEELEEILNVKSKMVEFLKKKIGDIVPKEAMSEGMRRKLELLEKIGSIVFKMNPKELEAIAYTIMDEDIGGVAQGTKESGKFLIRLNYKRLKFFCEETSLPPKDKRRECMKEFLGNLAHELTHIRTSFKDVTKDFEQALTETTGESLTEAIFSVDSLKKLMTEFAELFK